MKKSVTFTPVLVLLFVLQIHSQAWSSEAALIEVRPGTLDFGSLSAEEPASKTVVLRNVGAKPVRLKAAVSTCSCTIANLTPRVLQPGEQAELTITLVLDDYPSDKVSSILSIYGDKHAEPLCEIQVQANVLRQFGVFPESIDFGLVRPGTPISKPFYVFQIGSEELVVKEIRTPTGVTASTIELREIPDELPAAIQSASKIYEVDVQVVLPPEKALLNEVLTIVTSAKRLPERGLPINAHSYEIAAQVEPAVVVFGPISPGQFAGEVKLRVEEDATVTTASSDEAIVVSLAEGESAGEFTLTLKAADAAATGRHAGRVKILVQQGGIVKSVVVTFLGQIQ